MLSVVPIKIHAWYQGGARGAVADRVDVLRRGGDDRRAGRNINCMVTDMSLVNMQAVRGRFILKIYKYEMIKGG